MRLNYAAHVDEARNGETRRARRKQREGTKTLACLNEGWTVRKLQAGFALALFIGGACSTGHAASFDCTKAHNAAERLVCADPALSHQDELLAASYKMSRQQFDQGADGAKATLTDLAAAQQTWLAQRDACRNAACLAAAYTQQVALLDFHARPGHLAAADRWAGALDLPATQTNQATSDTSCGLNGSILWQYLRSTVQQP